MLTAAHLLMEVGSRCQVRAKQSFGDVEAIVVWKAQGWDIALIELHSSVTRYTPAVLGRLPEAQAGEKLPFQMYSYPWWGRTQRDAGKTAAGGRQIEGIIYLADRSPDGLLVLEPLRLPPEVRTEQSEWEGASGSVIVCEGLVVAVLSWHQNPKRPASLEAVPLLKACDDKQWCDLLRKHGIHPLDEMARAFFLNPIYLFGGGEETLCSWDLGWKANSTPYKGLEVEDTRYVDYSHALVGLKPSSLEPEKYSVKDLVCSGVLTVNRDLLHHRYRCWCDGWTEERQNLDFYELGCIFGQHFGPQPIFSPARFIGEISSSIIKSAPNATVYVEKGKRIEVLPMEWKYSWFTSYVDGKANNMRGWSLLDDDPNPFELYDMNDFFPEELEQYKQKKKKPE